VQQLFIKHANHLRGLINGLFPDFDLADDVLQDVFLVVTEKAATYRPENDFRGWAYGIAKRKALEHGRRYHRKTVGVFSPQTIELLCAAKPDEEITSAGDDHKQLAYCLEKLSPRMREMVTMRYQDNVAPGQIAEKLSWTHDAVYVALSRARSLLRRCLDIQATNRGVI
jgi:RNA polymerase sigma-70 factor (ECF subfamily)